MLLCYLCNVENLVKIIRTLESMIRDKKNFKKRFISMVLGRYVKDGRSISHTSSTIGCRCSIIFDVAR